jgi:hypothetical protein
MDGDIPGFRVTVNSSSPHGQTRRVPSSQCWSHMVPLAVYPTTLKTILAQRDKDYGDKINARREENVRISIHSSLMKMGEFQFTVVVSLRVGDFSAVTLVLWW